MAVANPREIPEYELNPLELQVRKSDGITKVWFSQLTFTRLIHLDDHVWSNVKGDQVDVQIVSYVSFIPLENDEASFLLLDSDLFSV